jgi:hypothetical protein
MHTMQWLLRTSSAVGFGLVVGCSSAHEVPSTAGSSSSPTASQVAGAELAEEAIVGPECFWIWTASDGAATSTRVCDEGGVPRVTETEPGIHVVVGGEDATLVLSEVHASGTRCTEDDDVRVDPMLSLVGRRLDLVRARGSLPLLEAPSLRGMEEFEDRIEVLATIGPYAAVRRFTHSYSACGAHAYEVTDEDWLNLETGEELPMPVPTDGERGAAVRALVRPALANHRVRAELLSYLEEEAEDGWSDNHVLTDAEVVSLMEEGAGSVVLGGLVPQLRSGRWMAQRVARYAIYENADAAEAAFEYGELPPPIAANADVPAAVQPFLRAPGGWSLAR